MLTLDGLNREQLEAVLHTEGPLLVLAGAGSGKTRVITYRLAHLIDRGVHPKQILCVTFTNKAAFEMKDRARKLVGKSVRGATISTFHALGVRILRKYADAVGLRKGFTICDGGEQLGSVRRILRAMKIDDRRFDAKRLLVAISKAKNAGIDADSFRASEGLLPESDPLPDDDDDYRIAAIETYERYQSALRTQNLVDFDDLLLLTVQLLHDREEILESLRDRWRYLMIDEYQDTNGAQFDLMRMLAGSERNLCVVGDDDQSIYGWRGADVQNILRFSRHFAGAKVVKLETNYRSTGSILEVANAIISKNPNRYDKRLRPAAGLGDRVRIAAIEDEEREADQVAASALALTTSGVEAKEIAVLFRSNVQSRALELAFRTAHVPYRVVGGAELFDKKEIKDLLAYLRLLTNPEDEQSLRRIVNFPPRGIGDKTVEKVDTWARERDLSLLEGLMRADEVPDLGAKSTDAIAGFVSIIRDHQKLLKRAKPSTIASRLIEAIGLEQVLLDSSDNPLSADRRVDNVREIVRQLDRYEHRVKDKMERAEEVVPDDDLPEDDLDLVEGATLDGFLRDLALSGIEDGTPKDERKDQVQLSTIHAAKGLEWKHVFLVGAEEELLPHKRTVEGDGEISEERRLTYVAVTRAREQLTISWAQSRTKWGKIVPRMRSRFLDDLPEDHVEVAESVKKPMTEEQLLAYEKDWRAKIREDLAKKLAKQGGSMTPLLLVLYVDMERAILATEEGRRAKETLAAEHARATKEIRKREDELRELSDSSKYDQEAEKLQREAAKQEEELDQKQDRLLAPIVEKLRKQMTKEVVDLVQQPLIAPPSECDVTDWLVRAYSAKTPLPAIKGCRFKGFVYVEFDRAIAQSAAGSAATKRLDAMKEKIQGEIDLRQRQLAEIERSLRAGDREKRAQYEEERREVAQLFARHQREMDLATRDAEDELYRTLEKRLGEAAKKHPELLFVEALPDQTKLEPNCDASDWAAAALDGKATVTELRKACSAVMK